MSKQPKQTKQKTSNLPLIISGIVIIVAVAAFVFTRPGAPAVDLEGILENIDPAAYQAQFDDAPHILIDVRTPQEFASGHIPGAINISVETLADRLSEIPEGQPVVVYCRSGNRSASAAQILAGAGYTDIYDLGGIIEWTAAGLPVQ